MAGGGVSTYKPEVINSPVQLTEGIPVEITLTIPAEKGKHKAWNQKISVMRATKDGIAVLELASLFVHNEEVKPLTDLKNLSVTIPSRIAEILKEKIVPTFRLNGEAIDVTWDVSPSLPLQIAEEETKELTISVPKSDKKYDEWSCKLKIKREKKDTSADPELTLTALKIAGETVNNLTDLDNLYVVLKNNIEKIEASEVKATFGLNGVKKDVQYTVEPAKLELKAGEKKGIKILVPAKPQEWKKFECSV